MTSCSPSSPTSGPSHPLGRPPSSITSPSILGPPHSSLTFPTFHTHLAPVPLYLWLPLPHPMHSPFVKHLHSHPRRHPPPLLPTLHTKCPPRAGEANTRLYRSDKNGVAIRWWLDYHAYQRRHAQWCAQAKGNPPR